MGFPDKKTCIIDMQLTEGGRQLLAQNQLRIENFAFSGELIDYGGSLSLSLEQSASVDEIVHKNFVPIEAGSMGGSEQPPNFSTFPYTAPEQHDVLPRFTANVSGPPDSTPSYTVYEWTNFIDVLGPAALKPSNDLDVVVFLKGMTWQPVTGQHNTSQSKISPKLRKEIHRWSCL